MNLLRDPLAYPAFTNRFCGSIPCQYSVESRRHYRAQNVLIWSDLKQLGLTLNEEQTPQIVDKAKNSGAR
jgi:hypothetical protein